MDNCIFCKIINKEINSEIIFENDLVVVFMSLEKHPLVVTKKHIVDIFELDDELGSQVMSTAIKTSKAVKAALNCDGVKIVQSNGVSAGQEIFHYHLHIKPRWDGGKNIVQHMTDIDEETDNSLIAAKIKAKF